MRLDIAPFFLLPVLVHSSTLSGLVPVSTIYPTQTAGFQDAKPASITSQQSLPSPTSSMVEPGPNVSLEDTLRSLALAGWVPITTIYPTKGFIVESSSTSLRANESTHTTVSTAEEDSHLELRQQAVGVGVGGGAPLPVPVPGQVSPLTTIYVKGVPVVYTQLFSAVPSQGPSASSGNIGLGTLTGSIGIVKTAEARKSGAGRMRLGKNKFGVGALGSVLVALMVSLV